MALSLQQIKDVMNDPQADLAAMNVALIEMVDQFDGLSQQFNQLYTRFNTHVHHLDVIDARGVQRELQTVTVSPGQVNQVLTPPIALQPGSNVRLSRAR